MKQTIMKLALGWLVFLASLPAVWAQDDYNPTNPPDPQELYNVIVTASPTEAASTSGNGQYQNGVRIYINCSLKKTDYVFKHWTLNGEKYSTDRGFYYTVGTENANFVAHFDYAPDSPSDPSSSDAYRLYLQSDPEGACSFNIDNGKKVEFDNYQLVTAYPNQNYDFVGWYENGQLVSENISFNYLMPARKATLVARFNFNPASPDDPNGDGTQDNVQNTHTGDVTKDGVINVKDVVALINRCLDSESTEIGLYDVTGDGKVDVKDVVQVINLSLQ